LSDPANNKDNKPEFRRLVSANDVPPKGTAIPFEADEAECAALARRFGIPGISRLSGVAKLRPWRKTGLTLDCSYEADLMRECVVTLEPMSEEISEEFTLHFLPDDQIERDARFSGADEKEILIDPEAVEPPEPFLAGGRVDYGEAVAEQLSLAMEPYPRKPGAALEEPAEAAPQEEADAGEERENPFAILEKLKKND
jgi:uncharacterized metal-binding protein YceD (DUF177 family)